MHIRLANGVAALATLLVLGSASEAWFGCATDRPRLLISPFDRAMVLSARNEWADYLKVQATVKTSIGLTMVLIPPGEFKMGTPRSDALSGPDETQHTVQISQAFYLGVYEVTQEEFESIMHRNPSMFSARGQYKDKIGGMQTVRFPVEGITWFDAVEFCNKFSEKDALKPYYALAEIKRNQKQSIEFANVTVQGGNGYRLPTEAEWEYACRAGTTTAYYSGNSIDGKNANVARDRPDGTSEPELGRTTTVGSYDANNFGLFDMDGNVSEWCWDRYADYDASTQIDPTGPTIGQERVLRGGSFFYRPIRSRCAARSSTNPDVIGDFGIRLARTAVSKN